MPGLFLRLEQDAKSNIIKRYKVSFGSPPNGEGRIKQSMERVVVMEIGRTRDGVTRARNGADLQIRSLEPRSIGNPDAELCSTYLSNISSLLR